MLFKIFYMIILNYNLYMINYNLPNFFTYITDIITFSGKMF